MSTVAVEQILVVPTSDFHKAGYFQGFSTEVERYRAALLRPELTSYRPRPEMEQDPSFKQLIPYVLFRHIDATGDVALFQYTRGKGQGEQRLHAKRSIGVGGHISSADSQAPSGSDPYTEGMRRELEEEVIIDTPYRAQCVGLINDDETEVGRVHLGVVHLFDCDAPRVHSREGDLCDAGFLPVAQLLAERDRLESWSRICLEALFEDR